MPWDSGWVFEPTDTNDLIGDECPELTDSPAYDKILEAFAGCEWWREDIYAMTETEKRTFTWEAFCKQVMHVSRFGFRPKPQTPDPADDTGFREPFEILEEIRKLCEEQFEAWYWIGPDCDVGELFRARLCDESTHYTALSDYGLPPDPRKAAQNRFSPAGIPMLYVCTDPETAALETAEEGECEKQYQCVGTLKLKTSLRVLDLTKFDPVPCIFDEEHRSKRAALSFLHQFARDVSRPISRGPGVHYEYVPTQVVAEFFRHVVKGHQQRGPTGLDAIAYASSRNNGGICLTVFPVLDRNGVKQDWQTSTFELGETKRYKAEWNATLRVMPLP